MNNNLLLAIAASISAFGVLIGGTVAIYRMAKRISDALGLDRDGRSLSERMERVEHQLWENGGSSLADRVNNIERHIVKVSTEIEFIKDLTLGLHNAQPETVEIVQPLIKPTKKRNIG